MKNLFLKSKSLFLSLVVGSTLLLTSCGGGSQGGSNLQIPGVDGPKIALVQDTVLITAVFQNLQLDGGLRYNIPKYPKSYLEISPDLQSSGTLLAINLSLDDVLDGRLQTLDPQTLPGGRALPGVAGGRLPAVAFTIEKFRNMSFYVGPKLFGVFIPINDPGIGSSIITARYYVGDNRMGNLSLVGSDVNGENAGILLMLDMGTQVKSQLKSLSQKY